MGVGEGVIVWRLRGWGGGGCDSVEVEGVGVGVIV